MDSLTLFERTLVDVTKYAKPGYYRPDTFFGDPNVPREPIKGSVQGLEVANNVLRPVDLSQKLGQDFGSRATAWEKHWSRLVDDAEDTFDPIVALDDHVAGALVIGHFGTVTGDRILVPTPYAGDHGSLNPILGRAVPAFLTRDISAWTAAGEWVRFSSSEQIYTVATSIDGMILMQLGYDVRGLDSEDPIMDIIISTVTADLGVYAVKGLVGTMLRKVWGSVVFSELRSALLKRVIAREEGAVGKELAGKLRAAGKRVVVNIGGTGEVAEAININPNVIAPRVGIPNHIAAAAEGMGEMFEKDSIDEIVSNSLPPNTLDWTRVLRGAQKVLRTGGKITIRFTGVGEDAKIIMAQLAELGFRDLQNGIRVADKIIGEGSVITAVK